jgi:hypothetical protein
VFSLIVVLSIAAEWGRESEQHPPKGLMDSLMASKTVGPLFFASKVRGPRWFCGWGRPQSMITWRVVLTRYIDRVDSPTCECSLCAIGPAGAGAQLRV